MRVNEDNFIEQLKGKNPKALDYIIDKYSPLIKGVTTNILILLGDTGLIDECISDVFIAIWNNSDKFNGDSNKFKSWVCAIAKFKAIDYYRKYSKKFKSELIDENITNGRSTEDDFIEELESNKLVGIIESFEEPDRSIFVMKFLLGEKSKSISVILGLTVSNINTRISRGKEKIRKQFYKDSKEVF
ncbi:sigma-70 family RNA polymerase sigma factor [Clostridium gasigenes]|uniref:sigma-70 family RNA polymerase sigma factor n=1 Tax=Clostridium gasigenes TaxID=94869 RepID=UPI001C0D7E12|nr:sigma-70 family RNA polymerase sigma factor [Clostridium gasigenes]MBU3109239.1 sigma-70 family RNA polymerase sigma factor [Clostridium gasigenes]